MERLHLVKIVLLFYAITAAQCQQINYFGVGYSPYVRSDGSWWNTYTLSEIQQMLRIVLTNHNSISSYSMGVSEWNFGGPWDQADGNCLIARACAHINREHNAVVLSLNQGIYQNSNDNIQRVEINNAFLAADEANRIRAGTVWGLTFTNEFIVNLATGQRVLGMIRDNRARARSMGLRVGTRVHICGEIWGGPNQNILADIARESDFILCNLYPGRNTDNANRAVQDIHNAYFSARDGFWRFNPNLQVIIGETGWASQGETFFNPPHLNTVAHMGNFWTAMRNWAFTHRVSVQMFAAFDEPWKPGPSGERHFGWWRRAPDNSLYYIEKTTGRIFR